MATWLAEFLDKLGTWSNQAWASLEPIMPNVAKIPKDFLEATQQTLYMTFWTALWSGIFGILLGVILVVTHDGGILENRWFYRILDQLVNIFRSIPFIILVALLATTTRFLAGTTIGSKAALVPLIAGVIPFFARQVENALLEVNPGVVEAAQAMGTSPWGIIFLLLGGLAWTAYNMMSAQKQVNVTSNRRLGVLITTGLQNLWGGIGFCLLVPILPEGVNTNLRSSAVWLIIYLAIGCSAVAFLLYTFGLTALKPSQAVAMLNLVPVFGVVWAIAIAGEHITPLKAIGAVTIIVGVAMNARNPQLSQEKQTHRHCIPSKG